MGKTTEELRSDLDALRGDLRTLRGDISELTSGLVEAGHNGMHDLNQRMKQEVRHRTEQVRNAGQQAVDTTRHKIEERPFMSVGGALAAGIVLGLLLHKRK